MSSETWVEPESVIQEKPIATSGQKPRLWLPVAFVACFWTARLIVGQLEMPYFYRFMLGMLFPGLLALSFFIWWWANRRIRLADRLYGFLLILGVGAILGPLVHESIGWWGLGMGGLPVVLTALTMWLVVARNYSQQVQRIGALAAVLLVWGYFGLIRIDERNADLQAGTHLRWTPTAEELFLAKRAVAGNSSHEDPSLLDWSPEVSPGDSTGYRGTDRDGVLPGVRIATDWKASPPKELWRHEVGPAWSSVIVVGTRLFTQEQWDKKEAVVCYDALTGQEIWSYEYPGRFEETVSGAGPRATPTYAKGHVFAVGATGIFNCLDAKTGKMQWSKDLAAEASAKVPQWGFSSSPLVYKDLVIVFAGGQSDRNLIAYEIDSGETAWTAAAGKDSYSSPELTTIAGKPVCVMLADAGLTAVDPLTGTVVGQHGVSVPGAPRTLEPHRVSDSQLLVHTIQGVSSALALLDITTNNGKWQVNEAWVSHSLKPEFPDLVVYQGHAYGFDNATFCCIDLKDGKRSWKGGRYGRGQVMLLPEQGLLLVTSEKGEVILLKANPERSEELGRFQWSDVATWKDAVTWNHPVVAHGRLYVRNDREMACYELASGE
jgi:outer membrane protein assembly factor BamB